MGFPITVGNKTFTSQDFEGRNYVYGYPELLKAFENKGFTGPEFLDFTLEQRIVPSFGQIILNLPTDVKFVPGQVLDLLAPDDSYMGVFIEEVLPNGVLGRVCYLSETLTKPHSTWKVGLGQPVIGGTYPGYLENRDKWFTSSGINGSEGGFYYFGGPASSSIGAFPGSPFDMVFADVVRTADPINDPAAGFLRNEPGKAISLVSFSHKPSGIPFAGVPVEVLVEVEAIGGHPSSIDIYDNLAIVLGYSEDLEEHIILEKIGTSITFNQVPVAGTYSNTDPIIYRFRYSSSTGEITLTVGSQTASATIGNGKFFLEVAGAVQLRTIKRSVYYV